MMWIRKIDVGFNEEFCAGSFSSVCFPMKTLPLQGVHVQLYALHNPSCSAAPVPVPSLDEGEG